jgi:hypothetical protein
MVRAGLGHVIVGVERRPVEELKKVCKLVYTEDDVKEVFSTFAKKYPQVFKSGSFVTCLPFDTRESMLDLVEYAKEIALDQPIIHPTIAVPGTYIYQEARANGLLAVKEHSEYNWIVPVMCSHDGLTTEDFTLLNLELNRRYFFNRPFWLIRKLFSPYRHIRWGHWFFVMNNLRMFLEDLLKFISGRKAGKMDSAFLRLRRPKWYDR